jgi:2-hydroxychromene-2-carboxylate isomerase
MGRICIDHYFSVLSDWAYLGFDRLEQVARRGRIGVNHFPISLAKVYEATGGILLQERSRERQRYREVELDRWRQHLGLPLVIHPKHYPVDDEPASRLIIAASMRGEDAGRIASLVLRAIWAEQRDISDARTLRDIAAGCGMDGDALLDDARSEETARVFERNTQEAIGRGVFGSPFYFLGNNSFWGQDRLQFLAEAI